MDDYDWADAGQSSPTEVSRHRDTTLDFAGAFDVSMKGWVFQGDGWRAGPVIGYQESRFRWTASGGQYRYNNGLETGSFPAGEKVVGYQQIFRVPYAGLTGQFRHHDIEVNGIIKYSNQARADARDKHYLRALSFRDNITGARYIMAGVDVGYFLTPSVKVYAGYDYNRISGGDGRESAVGHEKYRPGVDNINHTLSLGLLYRF